MTGIFSNFISITQTKIETLEKKYNTIPTYLSLNLPKGKTIEEINENQY
jgi:hypothetical protein